MVELGASIPGELFALGVVSNRENRGSLLVTTPWDSMWTRERPIAVVCRYERQSTAVRSGRQPRKTTSILTLREDEELLLLSVVS